MKSLLLIFSFIFFTLVAVSQARWSLELQGAGVYNVPMPLTIRQMGEPTLHLTAQYTSEPLVLPVYYDIRVGRWNHERSWEAEFIHHKLYLHNTTKEIQKFNISHGFNFLFFNRGFHHQGFRYRAGAGVVIAHPESEVRGQSFGSSTRDNDWGYYLTGPALQASVNRSLYVSNRVFFNVEAKTTLAYSRVKIA